MQHLTAKPGILNKWIIPCNHITQPEHVMYNDTPPIHLGREMKSAWTIEQSERVSEFHN